jgi:hypothetical protein
MNKKTKKQEKIDRKKEIKKKDKEFAEFIKKRANGRCEYSGEAGYCDTAHIIPREIEFFRWDEDNAVYLRKKYHKFSNEFSFHKNPFAFMLWFSDTHQEQFIRLVYKWKKYLEEKNELNR